MEKKMCPKRTRSYWKWWGSREINCSSLTRCTGTKATTVKRFSCILNFTAMTRSIANNSWRELWSRCQQKWDSIPTAHPLILPSCLPAMWESSCHVPAWLPEFPLPLDSKWIQACAQPLWEHAPLVFLIIPLIWVLRNSLLSERFICWARQFFFSFQQTQCLYFFSV